MRIPGLQPFSFLVCGVALLLLTNCDQGGDNPSGGIDTELDSVEVFDPATSVWDTLAPMPTPRSSASAAVIDGKLYVVGGEDKRHPSRPVYDVLEVYDPATDTWTQKASMPTRRAGPGTAAVDGKLYVFGGLRVNLFFDVLEIYDPATDTWSTGSSMPNKVYAPAVAVVDSLIYVAGGYEETSEGNRADVARFQFYHPATDSWSALTPMPTARGQGAAGVIDGEIYVVGGYLAGITVTYTLEVYTSGGSWNTGLQSMPTARGELVVGVIDGKLYAVGGLLASQVSTPTVEVYDPVLDSWTTGIAIPTRRAMAAAAVIGGKLYVVGGYQ